MRSQEHLKSKNLFCECVNITSVLKNTLDGYPYSSSLSENVRREEYSELTMSSNTEFGKMHYEELHEFYY
jgi:ubiquinone biosynthesis protein Coq4